MLRKNDRIRLTITDMGVNGEGIGKYLLPFDAEKAESHSRMTFFVKNAVIGDEVLAVVTGVKKGYGYAKVLEILSPSPDRVRPACSLAERCGGCQIMQLSYEAQLAFKENKVRNNLERIGNLSCGEFYPILGMEGEPLHYRNKMQFPVGWDREGHVVTGFYAGRTHYIIAAADCPASPEVNTRVLEAVRQFLEKHRISAYNEETGQGLIRHVLIRNGFATGQIMVCLVINGSSLKEERQNSRRNTEPEKDLVTALTGITLPAPWCISSICLNSNREKTNVILGKEIRCLYGQPFIEDQIASLKEGTEPLTFRISPLSFFQTNAAQTVRLYEKAMEFAGLTGEETVWDLYCGTGTISLFLARKAAYVHGVEIIPEAIRDAQDNARRNGISNVQFYCGRSEEIFPVMAGETDVVVLDPPRKGCDPALLTAIRKTGPKRIVYVSCDSATLARDLKILCAPMVKENAPNGRETDLDKQANTLKEQKTALQEQANTLKEQGTAPTEQATALKEQATATEYQYNLMKVQPVDMFPHTTHVECVVKLVRNELQ